MGGISFLQKRPHREKLAVVFDISSGSIGGALVGLSSSNPPIVLYTTRKELKLYNRIDFKKILISMEETLGHVLAQLLREGSEHLKFTKYGNTKPHIVYCVLGAPWNASHVREIKLQKKESFEITEELLQELTAREVESFENTESFRYVMEGTRKGEIDLIEKEMIQVKLNGYEVSNPVSRVANTLEISLYLSISPQDITNKIKEKILRAFHHEEIYFHSFMLSFYNTVRDIWQHERDFFLIDVSGEITDIGFVRDGSLCNVFSFPIGRNFFIRKISGALKTSSHEALSLLHIYITNKGSTEVNARLKTLLESFRKEWSEYLYKTLTDLGDGLYFPPHVFLTTVPPLEEWFKGVLSSGTTKENPQTTGPFTVNLLGHDALEHFLNVGNDFKKDPFLLVDSMFANKIYYAKK